MAEFLDIHGVLWAVQKYDNPEHSASWDAAKVERQYPHFYRAWCALQSAQRLFDFETAALRDELEVYEQEED